MVKSDPFSNQAQIFASDLIAPKHSDIQESALERH
jgi:hypothetical protein